jgi:hypothetical protein
VELTRETILQAIETNDSACVNALIKLYARQTADEQQSERTAHDNGVGFNGTDGPFLSSLAKQAIDRRRARNAGEVPAHWTDLSPKQIGAARKCLKKYARQLLEIAQETQAENAARRQARADLPTQAPTVAPVAPVAAPEVPCAPSVTDLLPSGLVTVPGGFRWKTAKEFHAEGVRLNLTNPGKEALMRRSQTEQQTRMEGFDAIMANIPEQYTPAQAQGY